MPSRPNRRGRYNMRAQRAPTNAASHSFAACFYLVRYPRSPLDIRAESFSREETGSSKASGMSGGSQTHGRFPGAQNRWPAAPEERHPASLRRRRDTMPVSATFFVFFVFIGKSSRNRVTRCCKRIFDVKLWRSQLVYRFLTVHGKRHWEPALT